MQRVINLHILVWPNLTRQNDQTPLQRLKSPQRSRLLTAVDREPLPNADPSATSEHAKTRPDASGTPSQESVATDAPGNKASCTTHAA